MEQQMIEQEINGCRIILFFSGKPINGVMEKIQAILSNAYDERVQNDLTGMPAQRMPADNEFCG